MKKTVKRFRLIEDIDSLGNRMYGIMKSYNGKRWFDIKMGGQWYNKDREWVEDIYNKLIRAERENLPKVLKEDIV